LAALLNRLKHDESRMMDTRRVCATCTSTPLNESIQCESLDCSWLFARKKSDKKAEFLEAIQVVIEDFGKDFEAEWEDLIEGEILIESVEDMD